VSETASVTSRFRPSERDHRYGPNVHLLDDPVALASMAGVVDLDEGDVVRQGLAHGAPAGFCALGHRGKTRHHEAKLLGRGDVTLREPFVERAPNGGDGLCCD